MPFTGKDPRGFTLIELMVVVGILCILTAVAIPVYRHGEIRGRIAWAERDGKVFVAAVESFRKEFGRLPSDLEELTRPTMNTKNQTVGPVLQQFPRPPAEWTYTYYLDSPKENFTIVAKGDGKTLSFPRPSTR